jgi:histone deacetylase complex regulatory component SIN3
VLPGFVPTSQAFVKENPSNPTPNTPSVKHTPKHHVQPKKPHVTAQKPSGVITPEDRAQWSIFGESLPTAQQAENNPPLQVNPFSIHLIIVKQIIVS